MTIERRARTKGKRRRRALTVACTTILGMAFAFGGLARAAVSVSGFAVTPSTTAAGGHPNLRAVVRFGDTSSGLKDVGLHLPAGLTANPRAAPFCTRKRLLADLCPSRSKVGSIRVVGVAFGLEIPITRNIYNARPAASERLRLGVPIFGSVSRPGFAAELPVRERPGDHGLDMAVVGLPREVNGIAIRIRELGFSIRGIVRTRVKGKLRRRPFITNPTSCTPAVSILELTSHDAPTTKVTASSVFTPTGCRSG